MGSPNDPDGPAWQCVLVESGTFEYPAEAIFPDRFAGSGGALAVPHNLLLVIGPATVLVDGGLAAPPGDEPAWRRALRHRGRDDADVSVVVITHLHPDHVEGLLDDDGDLVLPDPDYVVSRTEWDYWDDPANREVHGRRVSEAVGRLRSVLAKANLALVDPPCSVLPGVDLRPTPGHTPGSVAVRVAAPGRPPVDYVADVLAHALHREHLEWRSGFDRDPRLALATRRRTVADAAATGAVVLGAHLPPLEDEATVDVDRAPVA